MSRAVTSLSIYRRRIFSRMRADVMLPLAARPRELPKADAASDAMLAPSLFRIRRYRDIFPRASP